MANDHGTPSGRNAPPGAGSDRSDEQVQQEATEQRQDAAMQRRRADPSAEEAQVRREQGGHDRPVGSDHVPHRRPEPASKDGE